MSYRLGRGVELNSVTAEPLSKRQFTYPLLYSPTSLTSTLPQSTANQTSLLQDERHSYEKCQYVEFKKRVAKMEELRATKADGRSGLN